MLVFLSLFSLISPSHASSFKAKEVMCPHDQIGGICFREPTLDSSSIVMDPQDERKTATRVCRGLGFPRAMMWQSTPHFEQASTDGVYPRTMTWLRCFYY